MENLQIMANVIKPTPKQMDFLRASEQIVLFGGAVGFWPLGF